MLSKIKDEYKKLKGIIKYDTFAFIDGKKPLTVVIRTNDNKYLRYYNVDYLNLNFKYDSFDVYILNKGYTEPVKNNTIQTITIL